MTLTDRKEHVARRERVHECPECKGTGFAPVTRPIPEVAPTHPHLNIGELLVDEIRVYNLERLGGARPWTGFWPTGATAAYAFNRAELGTS